MSATAAKPQSGQVRQAGQAGQGSAKGKQIGTIDWAVSSDAPMGQEFSQLILEIQAREGRETAERIYIIDLGGIKHHLGERWDRFQEMVTKTAEESILAALSDQDFSRTFHDAYLLVFGDCPKVERSFKCTKVAWNICRTLFGEAGKVQDLTVQRVSVGPDKAVSLSSLWREAPVDRLMNSLAIEEELQTTDWSAAYDPTLPAEAGPIDFIYRPMWYTERKVVSNFVCMPACRSSGGEMLVGDAVLPPSGNAEAVKSMDFLTLQRVIHDLSQTSTASQGFIIGYPLHYQTMVDPKARQAYLSLCESIPEPSRKLSIIELVGLPETFNPKELSSLLQEWRPYARAMLARVRVHQSELQGYKGIGVIAVGSDLSESSRTESELIPLMEKFSERASKAKLKTYVHGLRSISMTTAAVCAGFDYVDGDAITSLAEAPTKSYPLSVESLYAHLAPPPA